MQERTKAKQETVSESSYCYLTPVVLTKKLYIFYKELMKQKK